MRIYLDTGIFIDFLHTRGNYISKLRSKGRRGRTLAQISIDAEHIFNLISQKHQGATSCLTYYEVEEALYRELSTSTKGVSHASKLIIPAARSLMTQTQMVIKSFGITALELSPQIVRLQLQTVELQTHGVRAADALHVASALHFGAELIISADEGILQLDQVLTAKQGKLRCLDTDAALKLL